MCCAPPRRRQLPDKPLLVATLSVQSVNSVRDLGVYGYRHVDAHAYKQALQFLLFLFRDLETDSLRCIRRSLTRSSLSTVIAFRPILSQGRLLQCRTVRFAEMLP